MVTCVNLMAMVVWEHQELLRVLTDIYLHRHCDEVLTLHCDELFCTVMSYSAL